MLPRNILATLFVIFPAGIFMDKIHKGKMKEMDRVKLLQGNWQKLLKIHWFEW